MPSLMWITSAGSSTSWCRRAATWMGTLDFDDDDFAFLQAELSNPHPAPGADLDNDGEVNDEDMHLWLGLIPTVPGDFDKDERVDIVGFGIHAGVFGFTGLPPTPGAGTTSPQQVSPEPATGLLLLGAFAPLILSRTRNLDSSGLARRQFHWRV